MQLIVGAAIIVAVIASIVFLAGHADAHFFGETRQVDNYQLIFMPYPTFPTAGDNSTFLNFSVLENGSNIFNIHSAVVITEKNSDTPVGQVPYRIYEFSDISVPYTFAKPGDYVALLAHV